MIDIKTFFDSNSLLSLIRRCELVAPLLRRKIEEEIIDIVPMSNDQISAAEISLIGQESRDLWLKDRGFDDADLKINATRTLALKAFARQRFGPGIEESFLASRGGRDEIVYSLLRVKNNGLARELYLRLVEGELTFPDAARQYGEGPEARHQGVIGPLRLDRLQPPELADSLRSLQPGEISRPLKLGVWHLILRLEHFLPQSLMRILLIICYRNN